MRLPRLFTVLVLVVGLLTTGVVAGATVVDPDGDGEPMLVELRDGTAPFDDDTDGDGLDDGAEKRHGTDPTVADSDGDGLADGTEVHDHGTDPLEADTDSDGLDDGAEIRDYETDPAVADTDGDGLDDGPEVRDYETDPLEADTDGDGIDDGTEVHQHGTNPLTTDSDDDGLSDPDELETYGTDPLAADTDGDGLADGPEIGEYDTDPTAADTDGDGLDDGAEVTEYGTDPLESDTDGDGLGDGAEVHRQDLYPDADPLRTDIYVELNRMEGVDLERAEIERVVDEFDTAPLANPDGSSGADLHVVYSGTIPRESSTDVGQLTEYRSRYFDRAGEGYHYLAIVENVAGDTERGNVIGMAGLGTMMVEAQWGDDHTGSTVMHELGHSLGLSNTDFDGIDSARYSFRSYTSVMNYDAPREFYGFSSESGPGTFDDWGYLDEHMFTPSTAAVTVDG
ncbi:hypothetical protein [Natrinema sp. DC36]|uniref:hypothetical protein n=1 Tax=Natrinema sp. DC36 TaxID=2878680 RepID=UPI001CEFE52A|nr:hypothetical protein [Natrinema sp. DC36]